MKKSKPKSKTQPKGRRLTTGQLQREILKVFSNNPKKRLNPRQIIRQLQVANNRDSVQHALEKLVDDQRIQALEDFKFKLRRGSGGSSPKRLYEGFVDITRKGSAYITCEDLEEDIHVPARNLGSALHGDRVLISAWRPRGRRRMEGEVMKVVERATDRFVGTIYLRDRFALVAPSRIDVPVDILVEFDDTKNAEEGDRVVVQVVNWPKNPGDRPRGVITAVLGAEGSDLEMKTILINNGFNLEFPAEVMVEAEALPDEISAAGIAQRRDFRRVPTMTIDPEDAKDFDDALSIEYLENGHVEVGVHIADVTHFVALGSALDKEAYHRSTSVYLVDRVLPMLPERISNNLCSLRPDEDRLTFSAVFEFDKNHKLVERWFGKGIIHSDRRFSYEQAQDVIESRAGDFAAELRELNKFAREMRKQRFKAGAIDFDMEEVRFRLDKDGVPVELFVKERKDAHLLIEEFMLLANREVATYIHKKSEGHEIPFVYRIHDYPNPEKVAELALFAKEMGFQMRVNTPKEIAASFNRLVEESEKNEALKLLQPIAIRTMSKAEYSTNNIGHYGLAFDNYSHFTSPIRRYSDVLAHRILEQNLDGKTLRVEKDNLEERCKHISLQERKAMSAERESIKYKQVEFMEKHVGEVFDGYISGMIDRGVFVELKDSKCEGMVGFETMRESFDVEEGRLRAKGNQSGRVLKMGELVKVRIRATDLAKRQIDMELE
jgi:ribonuclease R